MDAKTEQPTPRRLRRAREQGDSPVSAALVQAGAFAVVVLLAPAAVAALVSTSRTRLLAAMSGAAPSTLVLVRDVLLLSVPVLAGGAAAALLLGLVQTGGVFAIGKTVPDLRRLDPWLGLKQLFNVQRAFAIARALLAACLVGWFSLKLLRAHAPDVAASSGNTRAALAVAGLLAERLLWLAAAVGAALGVLDWAVARFSWLRRHRMSRQEIRQELKETEGDPELAAARRRARQELLAGAMIAAVRDATVVVVNPTHLATALHYDASDDEAAPRVVAHGRGELARQMLEAAHAWGIPVVRDVPLARALDELELGQDIPEELYEAVAEILRELWERETKAPSTGP